MGGATCKILPSVLSVSSGVPVIGATEREKLSSSPPPPPPLSSVATGVPGIGTTERGGGRSYM